MITTVNRSFPVLIILTLAAVVSLAGCSEKVSTRFPVHPASGVVTVKGAPVAGVLVVLNPTEGTPLAKKGVTPSGTTDERGIFSLTTYTEFDGAPVGDYRVTLQWLRAEAPREGGPPPGFAPLVDRFKGRYRDPAKSVIKISIGEGNNVLESIAVE